MSQDGLASTSTIEHVSATLEFDNLHEAAIARWFADSEHVPVLSLPQNSYLAIENN